MPTMAERKAALGLEEKMDGETHGGGGGVKGRKYDVSDTNVAGIGTDLDKAIREAAAGHEEAWVAIDKKKPGVIVWRIEKFLVKPWPRSKLGKFYNGDSYIVLNTYHKATHSGKGRGAIAWDIHFWIGSESSQDEYGTAAYKTVELDDFLEGKATQYRETEGNESRAFKKLFKSITIMPGGIDSGFNKVGKVSYEKKLLQIKGKMGNVTVKRVPLTWESLNRGDCFVLDSGEVDPEYPVGNTDGMMLCIVQGDSTNPMEKMKAAGIASSIDDDRGGKPDRQTYMMSDIARMEDFWKELGSRPGQGQEVKSAEEGGDDANTNAASGEAGTRRLLQVSDDNAEHKVEMKLLGEGEKISRAMVHSKDVFILDDGQEIMVWIGKEASISERRKAMSFGQTYLNDYGLPADRCIVKLMDGGENEMFEQAFEIGVMSLKRPGEDGVKFGGGIDKIRGLQKTKAASATVSATYAGSGGPGVSTDFDLLYQQESADPADWKGRTKKESAYSKEMQDASAGAYSKESGWVSSLSKEELAQRLGKVQALEKKYTEMGKDGGAVHAGGSQMLTSAGTEPSLTVGASGFNAEADADTIYKAMKGMGTRKEPIISTLCGKTLGQRIAIRKAYDTKYPDGTLMDTFDSEWQISGNFKRLLKVLVRDPYERDANFLYKAMKGLRADTTMIMEVLCTQESSEIQKVAEAYAIVSPGHTLVDDLQKEFNGAGKKESQALFTKLAGGSRPPAGPVDIAKAKEDAAKLVAAGEKKMIGADQMAFVDVIAECSFGQIVALVDAYKEVSKKKWTLEKAISKKCSGTVKAALKVTLGLAQDPTAFWTERLHKAINVIGVNDPSLIRTMVSRAELDLSTIEALYSSKYGHPLQEDLGKDSGKPYLKMLRQIVEGNAAGQSEA